MKLYVNYLKFGPDFVCPRDICVANDDNDHNDSDHDNTDNSNRDIGK